ncbi:MAG TPA: lanthionine synthetase LanC family protein, partial [Candidatus Angelobacter sp.]|nr:lanthionine synthetase LanC family protein [Candidatus Angelobacter sp.]
GSSGKHTTTFNPTFFRGVAGVGYSLLRLLYPEMFPCVLLLETQN